MLKHGLLAFTLCLGGCASGVIQSVELATGERPAVNKRLNIIVSGTGTCNMLNVNWGDAGNSWESFSNVDLTARTLLSHTYAGWAGGKTVTVEPQSRCAGTARMRFTTAPSDMSFGWARLPSGVNPTACFRVPSSSSPGGVMPPLPANVLVRVMGALRHGSISAALSTAASMIPTAGPEPHRPPPSPFQACASTPW